MKYERETLVMAAMTTNKGISLKIAGDILISFSQRLDLDKSFSAYF